jgi:dihydroneopterin aldolase
MKIERFCLFLEGFEIDVSIGIHDFERNGPQRLAIGIEIAMTFDYDWVRDEVHRLAKGRHFNLQETLAQEILAVLSQRSEIVRAVVETAKPDVYPDVDAVGCRIEARRQ